MVDDASTAGLERVFIHPSSVNFANTAFRPSNYLLYGERQLSVTLGGGGSAGAGSSSSAAATGSTDRAYIRDTSEVVLPCHFALSVSLYSLSIQSLLQPNVTLTYYSLMPFPALVPPLSPHLQVSAFPLLFFGGKLEAQYLEGTVTVDGWIRFSAPGKIVALIQVTH